MLALFPTSKVAVTLAAAAVSTLALAGCSSGGGASNTSAKRASGGTATSDTQPLSAAGQPAGPKAATSMKSQNSPISLGAAKIITAELTVAVRPAVVDSTADRATGLVEAAGGQLAGDQRSRESGTRQADLVLKVPPVQYPSVLSQLAGLGTEVSRSASETDVTDQVVDVGARVAAQRASVNRVSRLMAGARNLGDVVLIEGELSKRQADLESLEARQRALDAQTSAATITLHVRSTSAAAVVTPPKPVTGFAAGLKSGWRAFTAALALLLTALGALLPFAVVAALAGGAFVAVRRRRQAAAGPPVAAAPAP